MCDHRSPRARLPKPPSHDNRRPTRPAPEPDVDPLDDCACGDRAPDDAAFDDAACVDPACCASARCAQVCADPTPDDPVCADSEQPADAGPEFDVDQALGALQADVGRVDALICATEQHFERFGWRCSHGVGEGDDPINHLAHLIGAARTAARAAVRAGEVLARAQVGVQRGWDS